MSIELTLYGERAEDIMQDVYFREDFALLHARPDPIDSLIVDGFRCVSAVRSIEGAPYEDMETPWGYGGPVAIDDAAFWRGIGLWRQKQSDWGRIAEFTRIHPFLNPVALRGFLDQIRFDRLTVLVDLCEPTRQRRKRYNKGTRYSLRKAEQRLEVRQINRDEAAIFRRLYEAGLSRNVAENSYYFDDSYFNDLLSAEWSTSWAACLDGEPIAVACFLQGGPFAHYHLSGGGAAARENFAHYILLEAAFEHFAAQGLRWLHLGGGRSAAPDDQLLHFKAKFSPILIPFYTGGIVFDGATYKELSTEESERFLSYRFAPPQTSPDPSLALRVADASAFQDFFRLKCDIDNIIWSGARKPPAYDHLSNWYGEKVSPDSGRTILIAENHSSVVGYAYVDDVNDGLDITVGLAASRAQRQVFRPILGLVLDWIANERSGLAVYVWLYDSNRFLSEAFKSHDFIEAMGAPTYEEYTAATGANEHQRRWKWCPDGTNTSANTRTED
jgi:UDP-N-acetylbacillosamine alanyltransferase